MSDLIVPPNAAADGAGLVGPDGAPVQAYTPPTNGQVMAEAKKTCQTCKGKGHFYVWVYADENTQVRIPKVCRCAVRRWEKKHGKNVLTGKPAAEA